LEKMGRKGKKKKIKQSLGGVMENRANRAKIQQLLIPTCLRGDGARGHGDRVDVALGGGGLGRVG